MGEQRFSKIKKTVIILLAVFLVISLTAASASAWYSKTSDDKCKSNLHEKAVKEKVVKEKVAKDKVVKKVAKDKVVKKVAKDKVVKKVAKDKVVKKVAKDKVVKKVAKDKVVKKVAKDKVVKKVAKEKVVKRAAKEKVVKETIKEKVGNEFLDVAENDWCGCDWRGFDCGCRDNFREKFKTKFFNIHGCIAGHDDRDCDNGWFDNSWNW